MNEMKCMEWCSLFLHCALGSDHKELPAEDHLRTGGALADHRRQFSEDQRRHWPGRRGLEATNFGTGRCAVVTASAWLKMETSKQVMDIVHKFLNRDVEQDRSVKKRFPEKFC